ncbi:prephenate dehydratase [Bacillus seohaeanensis]|uniref:Prephenate dehydratase n=1 Tax=Bacillus seohaeanensis TaxID=284580 RepID=A0ABW5RTD5_9BACI
MKIAYLGPEASFTNLAVKEAFSGHETLPYVTIPDCIEAVIKEEVEAAVVPLENALEGSVHITVDYLFHESELNIVAEMTSPIQQHLMIHDNTAKEGKKLEKILSHSHALAQCHKFLHSQFQGVPLEQTTSTAAAAKLVSENPDIPFAAIGNQLASEIYGLTILQDNIHDFPLNHTKFIVLHKDSAPIHLQKEKAADKTTLMVTLPADRSGALHQVLSTFAWRQLSLSKIESRPLKTGLGNYFFIIDVAHSMDDVLLPGAISEMEALGCKVKVVGTYSSYLIEK